MVSLHLVSAKHKSVIIDEPRKARKSPTVRYPTMCHPWQPGDFKRSDRLNRYSFEAQPALTEADGAVRVCAAIGPLGWPDESVVVWESCVDLLGMRMVASIR